MLYLILLTEYVQRLLCSAKQYLITYFTDAENANLLFQRMPSFNAYKCYSNLLEFTEFCNDASTSIFSIGLL